MADVKFPVKIYTYPTDENAGNDSISDFYDVTEKELEDKCVIYALSIYWKNSIPKSHRQWIEHNWVELYDIWNFECSPWWEWPDNLQEIMFQKVRASRPKEYTDYLEYLKLYEENKHCAGVIKMTYIEFLANRRLLMPTIDEN